MPDSKQCIHRQRTRAPRTRGTRYPLPSLTWQVSCGWPLIALRRESGSDIVSLRPILTSSVGVLSYSLRQQMKTRGRLFARPLAPGCVVHTAHSDPTRVALTPGNGVARAS